MLWQFGELVITQVQHLQGQQAVHPGRPLVQGHAVQVEAANRLQRLRRVCDRPHAVAREVQ
ncbi:hypothetical protein D3C81_2212150 [compost metagenome]